MTTEETNVASDLHSMALSQARIAATLERIADKFCGVPTTLVGTHGEPTKESVSMAAKPAKLGMKRVAKSTAAPAGDKDVFTVVVLDQQGNVIPTDPSWVMTATSGDPTIVTMDPPIALAVGEHFLKAGTVTDTFSVEFPDGTSLSLTDSLTVTGVPGSLVGSHSTPVVGP